MFLLNKMGLSKKGKLHRHWSWKQSGYVAAIVSGERGRLDFQAVACKKVKLASPKQVEQVTGYQIGTVPLVGVSLPCLFDRRLYRYSFIYGGTGVAGSTLKISPEDVEKLNQVTGYLLDEK